MYLEGIKLLFTNPFLYLPNTLGYAPQSLPVQP